MNNSYFFSYNNNKIFLIGLFIILIITFIINIINLNYDDFYKYNYNYINPIFNSNLNIPKPLINFNENIDVFN